MKPNESFLDRALRHWISLLFFIGILLAYLVGSVFMRMNETLQHILLTLTAVWAIHLLDRLFLYKDAEGVLKSLVEDVKKDIAAQTEELKKMSQSLDSMARCGIVQVYTSRVDAAPDMKRDLLDQGNSKIRLIGISLNDFIQSIDQSLGEAWDTLQQYILGNKLISNSTKNLDIKILIIDPLSFGAALRSGSESHKTSTALETRLDTDVMGDCKILPKT